MMRKYLDELGISKENRPDLWCPNDKREERWGKQREEYGFDDRETWDLNLTFYLWLYERLSMFLEVNKIVDLDYHKFIIDGEELTQRECIDRMIEGCRVRIVEADYYVAVTEDQKKKISDVAKIWAEVLPAMWW